jgi:hypothetical protein
MVKASFFGSGGVSRRFREHRGKKVALASKLENHDVKRGGLGATPQMFRGRICCNKQAKV